MTSARSIRIRGIVQGVGFRPFVSRLARARDLAGWVVNDERGVEIHLEGGDQAIETFVRELDVFAPPAARIAAIDVERVAPVGLHDFTIRDSRRQIQPSVAISPDLPVCEACLRELFDPLNRRHGYPYINCTQCGPRYSLVLGLPYDRARTTMREWTMDPECMSEYGDAANRRFHAQPLACHACGPGYRLEESDTSVGGVHAVQRAADLLNAGHILAVKGVGGFHLACDARNARAVAALRARKYRKERPFALMARDLALARTIVELSPAAEGLLTSPARPIVVAPALTDCPGVAPDHHTLGVMLPYAPVHFLLFAAGAPAVLVMTSANRSSEPLAYEDDDARQRLAGIADAFLVGGRRIARRVDDSIAVAGALGPMILRRARGYAPGAVAVLPTERPIVAVGADLKNAVTLVVGGHAFGSQHIGDLQEALSFRAFEDTVHDLVSMYGLDWRDIVVAHDLHPEYRSTQFARELPARTHCAVQHHRAHIASVLAEREAWHTRVLGLAFDGTGFGDDGTIWGGEVFVGGLHDGLERIAHLRPAALPGGDAAARHPVRAAAGFLSGIDGVPDVLGAPFGFPDEYLRAASLVRTGVRTFTTTSVGRLFDTAAALLGYTRPVTFEGQAAMWLEHLARPSQERASYPFPFEHDELDYRPLLSALIADRVQGRPPADAARAFQRGFAQGVATCVKTLCRRHGVDTIVLSGGVFQNDLLLQDLKALVEPEPLRLWTNRHVPANDGGISLGQAALAAIEGASRRP